jgi:hypothetical protein
MKDDPVGAGPRACPYSLLPYQVVKISHGLARGKVPCGD